MFASHAQAYYYQNHNTQAYYSQNPGVRPYNLITALFLYRPIYVPHPMQLLSRVDLFFSGQYHVAWYQITVWPVRLDVCKNRSGKNKQTNKQTNKNQKPKKQTNKQTNKQTKMVIKQLQQIHQLKIIMLVSGKWLNEKMLYTSKKEFIQFYSELQNYPQLWRTILFWFLICCSSLILVRGDCELILWSEQEMQTCQYLLF